MGTKHGSILLRWGIPIWIWWPQLGWPWWRQLAAWAISGFPRFAVCCTSWRRCFFFPYLAGEIVLTVLALCIFGCHERQKVFCLTWQLLRSFTWSPMWCDLKDWRAESQITSQFRKIMHEPTDWPGTRIPAKLGIIKRQETSFTTGGDVRWCSADAVYVFAPFSAVSQSLHVLGRRQRGGWLQDALLQNWTTYVKHVRWCAW